MTIGYLAFSTATDRLSIDDMLRAAIVCRKGMSPDAVADELESVAAQIRARKGPRIRKNREIYGRNDFTDRKADEATA